MGLLQWLGLDMGCERAPLSLNENNFEQEVLKSPLPVIRRCLGRRLRALRGPGPDHQTPGLQVRRDGQGVRTERLGPAQTAGKLGVRGTPTVLFFKDRAIRERVVGMRGQHFYEEILSLDFGIADPAAKEAANA